MRVIVPRYSLSALVPLQDFTLQVLILISALTHHFDHLDSAQRSLLTRCRTVSNQAGKPWSGTDVLVRVLEHHDLSNCPPGPSHNASLKTGNGSQLMSSGSYSM